MKIAIITDTHFGARQHSKQFTEYFSKFYEDIFFPRLEKEGITTILHGGDLFDNRTSMNINVFNDAKRIFLDKCKNYDLHVILGNHDIYYNNTLKTNTLDTFLKDQYPNIRIYDKATNLNLGNTNFLLVPWINKANSEDIFKTIENSKADICLGHFEINGFSQVKGHKCDNGISPSIFNKFKKVWSGHFHIRSEDKNIRYLGSPYPLTWGEVEGKHGFHVYDTDKDTIEFIENPYEIFHYIRYNDNINDDIVDYNLINYKDKIVKLEVMEMNDPLLYDNIVLEIEKTEPYKFEKIDRREYYIDNNEIEEAENTQTIISEYLDKVDTEDIDKKDLKDLFFDLYKEAV